MFVFECGIWVGVCKRSRRSGIFDYWKVVDLRPVGVSCLAADGWHENEARQKSAKLIFVSNIRHSRENERFMGAVMDLRAHWV
jgi:hypothetical protein